MTKDFTIRTAVREDFFEILSIYETARAFMRKTGNETQWGDHYPPQALIENDMENGQLYVVEQDRVLQGVFMFVIGEDPTYAHIEEGKWTSMEKYGVIHRVASAGKTHGLISAILRFCEQKIGHLRIDTHENNQIMQHILLKNGFRKCGIIYASNGTARLAFEKT